MALVSIVVAGYNAERFVKKCLESISRQHYGDWEAVLVDDGSEDGTGEIFVKRAKEDSRFKAIVKENGGTSSARNKGLSVCTGEWVWFVDADDWLELCALEELSKIVQETDADIVGFNHFFNVPYQKGTNERMVEWKQRAIHPEVLTKEGKDELKWLALGTMSPCYVEARTGLRIAPIREAWSKVFRRSFLEAYGIRFDEKVSIVEDTVFCFDAFVYANKVAIYNRYLIHYRMHTQSKIRRFQPDMKQIDELTMESYRKRMEQWGRGDDDFRPAFLGVCTDRFFEMLKCYVLHEKLRHYVPEKKRSEILQEIVQGSAWDVFREETDLRYLPRGKREIVYCVQRGWYEMACVTGRFLLWGMQLQTYLRRWRNCY
ncbi:MAG: glycosyltransferase family 2 protein [Tannerellaceae bacterium]|jgi:glycosyltransferase involved in cell wall biosynthesis|nr:glycosyltransferase family 2 protein [Tannerellaceae bacterium]